MAIEMDIKKLSSRWDSKPFFFEVTPRSQKSFNLRALYRSLNCLSEYRVPCLILVVLSLILNFILLSICSMFLNQSDSIGLFQLIWHGAVYFFVLYCAVFLIVNAVFHVLLKTDNLLQATFSAIKGYGLRVLSLAALMSIFFSISGFLVVPALYFALISLYTMPILISQPDLSTYALFKASTQCIKRHVLACAQVFVFPLVGYLFLVGLGFKMLSWSVFSGLESILILISYLLSGFTIVWIAILIWLSYAELKSEHHASPTKTSSPS